MAQRNASPVRFGVLGLVVAVLASFPIGCNSRGGVPAMPVPVQETWKVSDAIDIDVYVDGSGSIRNFLQGSARANGQTNYLEALLDKCETTLHHAPGTGGWKSENLRFFRFGAGVDELPSATGLQTLSQNPSMFNASRTRIETPVNDVPKSAPGETRPELKIIVTDLYQSGGEIERPADSLADKYLTNETDAVGVLAVRNAFTGDVEDLPGTPVGRTLPHAADSMPFYVIFAGPAPDVRHAMDALVRGVGLDDAMQKGLALELFFSRKPLAASGTPPALTGSGFSMLKRSYDGSGIPLIALKSGTLTAKWAGHAEGAKAVDLGQGADLQATALKFGKGAKGDDDPRAAQAATSCGTAQKLCAAIDRGGLEAGASYRFEFDEIESTPSDVLGPHAQLLRDWNIEVQQAEAISRTTHQFPADAALGGRPGKTPNLSEFLMALQGQMFHTPVRMASYYLYVQAK